MEGHDYLCEYNNHAEFLEKEIGKVEIMMAAMNDIASKLKEKKQELSNSNDNMSEAYQQWSEQQD